MINLNVELDINQECDLVTIGMNASAGD